jgi:hypothetical protein
MNEPRFQVPELDPELQSSLSKIIDRKTYEGNDWELIILPRLIVYLRNLQQLAISDGEQFNDHPATIDLKKSITDLHSTILHRLNQTFKENPPFTILRIAEILCNPSSNGYNLVNNANLFKYFNSLSKLTLVSSNVSEYEPVSFGTNFTNTCGTPPVILSQSVNVQLVEIPWLKNKREQEDTKTAKSDLSLSPRRRKTEEDDDDNASSSEDIKRSRKNDDKPDSETEVLSLNEQSICLSQSSEGKTSPAKIDKLSISTLSDEMDDQV